MKFVHTYEKVLGYAIVRENTAESTFQKYLIEYEHLLIILLQTVCSVCLAVCLFETNTLQTYSETIYTLTTLTGTTIILILFQWRKKEFFELIDNFEKTIEKRE